ncbi:MAG: thiosulfate oxidation carrier complex protein SoxZ [Candidatus Sedimenticola sp. (ex Thyasira tokunagai)]
MAKKSIRVRAKFKGGVTTVRALMSHPMESGNRKNKAGKKIPAHFIQEVTCDVAGKNVITSLWGGGVAKSAYLSFKFNGGKGEKLKLTWVDNQGKSDSMETAIKG